MKDVAGNELKVGDKVAYTGTYGNSKSLNIGYIIGFSKNFAEIIPKWGYYDWLNNDENALHYVKRKCSGHICKVFEGNGE